MAMPPLRVPDQVLAPGRLHVLWHRVVLAAILTLSAFVNLFQLTSEGYGNTYYAAAVKNMLTSWRNFFFVTFDAGFVSVDKPPLGFGSNGQRQGVRFPGSSSNNTMMDLIVGHNGAGRLTGQDNDVGDRGPLRLLKEPVGEQIGWLLPLAAVGLAVAI
jgi:hypothetical protein